MRRARAAVQEVETALAAAREEARQSRGQAEILGRALDAIQQGVVVCDDDGRVIYRNKEAVALSDPRHTDALAARAVTDLLSEARLGRPISRQLDLLGPPPRTVIITAHQGVAVIDDITERRNLDSVRRDFVANVSHELRTPIGALGVLADTLASETDIEIVARLSNRIRLEAERAGRLIEDLLDLSRIEAEGSDVREPVSISSVIERAAERCTSLAEHHGVDLVVTASAYETPVTGSQRQLISAVGNLIENGVRYSEPGSKVEVDSTVTDTEVLIVVRDFGVGIPTKDLDRIFERFYRVDRARSRETGGSGLGLAIVRHAATNHGGSVTVESREGEGSTFTIRLPKEGRT